MQTKHPTQQAVTPSSCALAIAIPLTREQFLGDLAKPEQKDFARHIKHSNPMPKASNEYYWNEFYGPLARVIEQICDEVEELGVTVKRYVAVHDLFDLMVKFRVVTLVAHWRFSRILPVEILDPQGFLGALQNPKQRVHRAVRITFEQRCPELLDSAATVGVPAKALQENIADQLNVITGAAHALYNRAGDSSLCLDQIQEQSLINPLERLTRISIEQAFPSFIAKSRAVEFSDGMHTVDEVINEIPVAFDGLLDLTICNSVILGAAIKNCRPRCAVAVNRYPAEIHVRMALYKLAVVMLSRRPGPFMEVLTRIHIT